MKNTKYWVACLFACLSANQASAATDADSLAVLAALPVVDTAWMRSNEWSTVDPLLSTHAANWDASIDQSSDPCGEHWVGILCNADNQITHLELPNAGLTGSLSDFFDALEPIKNQLVSINLSSTGVATANVFSGALPDTLDSAYQSLRFLGLAGLGISGGIPNMTDLTMLEVADFSHNALDHYIGPVGGFEMRTLMLSDNHGLVGDVSNASENSLNLTRLDIANTALSGHMQSVESVSAATIDDSLVVNWSTSAKGLEPPTFALSYSRDEGETWTNLPAVEGVKSAVLSDMPKGVYLARVQPQAFNGLVDSEPLSSGLTVLGEISTSAGGGSSSGGGALGLCFVSCGLVLGFRRAS